MKNKNLLITLIVLCLILTAIFWIPKIKENHIEKKLYEKYNSTFESCKLDVWIECGIPLRKELCYQIGENNDSKWEDCPVINETQRSCWITKQNDCFAKEISERIANEKENNN